MSRPRLARIGASSTSNDTSWTTTKVYFHNFTNLSTTKRQVFISPEFTCLGYTWSLDIFPGGSATSTDGMVAIFLANNTYASVNVEYSFGIRDGADKEVVSRIPSIDSLGAFGHCEEKSCNNFGYHNFAKRSQIIKFLDKDGALVIEVRMRLVASSTPLSIPQHQSNKYVLKMFDRNLADNEAQQQSYRSIRKKIKAFTTILHTTTTHPLILRKKCTIAYNADTCRKDRQDTISIPIADVRLMWGEARI